MNDEINIIFAKSHNATKQIIFVEEFCFIILKKFFFQINHASIYQRKNYYRKKRFSQKKTILKKTIEIIKIIIKTISKILLIELIDKNFDYAKKHNVNFLISLSIM